MRSRPRIAPRPAPTVSPTTLRWRAPGRCWWAGSKVSTKLMVLEALLDRVDKLIVGGGIANTFLAATGVHVGRSLCETEMLDVARRLMDKARARDAEIP